MTAISVSPPAQRFLRPTWAEIDLGRLRDNLRLFRSKLAPRKHRPGQLYSQAFASAHQTKLMFVVKGNAYGHGAATVSREAEMSGLASWLGVSSVEEGIALRQEGIRMPILVLGSLYPFESFSEAVRHGLTPTVASLEAARRLAQTPRAQRAVRNSRVRCHVKLDTGMGRIGMGWPSGMGVVQFIAREKGLELEGVYTHFASAETSRSYTRTQMSRFQTALAGIRRAGISVRYAHAANSAAALKYPETRLNLVRPGLALYGLFGKGFQPILNLKCRIVFVKNVEKGTPIGYGTTYRTRRLSRIATLPIGYADGYPRALSNRADVLVHGKRCPVVGTVSMDMTTVDVTGVPQARVGDEVVLAGRFGREEVSVTELSHLAGTIPYEIATRLSSRVPRIYIPSPLPLPQRGRGAR